MQYSFVVPVFNERRCLQTLLGEITRAMSRQSYDMIAIDDASTDGSFHQLKTLQQRFPALRAYRLPVHAGKWEALRTGIQKSRGDVVITCDADLQDDPAEIKKLLPFVQQGYDVVSGWRRDRQDPWYKIVISQLGNAVISVATRHRFHDLNAPLKVFRRIVLSTLPLEGSLFRFSLLFAYRMGFRVAEIPIRHRPRRYGHSKFGVMKYLRILCDLVLVLLLFSGSGRIRNHVRIGRS